MCLAIRPAGQSGKSILANFKQLLADSSADRATYGPLPFALTEVNARTASDFASST